MRISLLLVILILSGRLLSQSWQQKIDYDIDGHLDDQRDILIVHMTVVYHNNSPNELPNLMLHTWMNAFGRGSSPYSKQLNHLGMNNKLNLSSRDEGGYQNMKFNSRKTPLRYRFIDDAGEILELELNKPCRAGETVSFEVDYVLDIPKNISRGGHIGKAYQMTQWYPKVAMYDTAGWHTMPYLELGEYFNEFGDYKVTITLPTEYKVAATGTLTNQDEIIFLKRYADSCQKYESNAAYYPGIKPTSQTKTLSYVADHVIDFAWFADVDYKVNRKEIMSGDRKITVWSYYYPSKYPVWNQATTYGEHAIHYFDSLVGPYPYPQISLVECNRRSRYASDAMEYPMITLIDNGYNSPPELEKVIVHEVGHNWFQAILATDERTHAWMDEGFVTYYEHRYADSKGIKSLLSLTPWTLNSDYDHIDDFNWYISAARDRDAASTNEAETYTTAGYLESIYEKPAKGLSLMAKSLGQAQFDTVMRAYYDQWKFKHPSDKDLFNHFNKNGISWYDGLYLNSNQKVNVTISPDTIANQYRVSSDAPFAFPLNVVGYVKNEKIYDTMISVSNEPMLISINGDTVQYLIADPDFLLPETKRIDNIVRFKSTPFAPKKTVLHLIPGLGHSLTNDLYLNPAVLHNLYDGFAIGGVIHNLSIPATPLQFAGMVGYGLNSHKPVILARAQYSFLLHSYLFDRLSIGLDYRDFSLDQWPGVKVFYRYTKLAPGIHLFIKPNTQYSARKEISFRSIFINQTFTGNILGGPLPLGPSYNIHELKFESNNYKTLHPFSFNLTAESGQGYGKVFTSYKAEIPYSFLRAKSGEWRLFAGFMYTNSSLKINSLFQVNGLTGNGFLQNDYKLDEFLLGRSETDGRTSQQIFEKDAGFYSLGRWPGSNRWMLATSYRTMLPGPLPIRPYVQFAVYPSTVDNKLQWLYSTGVSLTLLKNIIEINFPLVERKTLSDSDLYGTHNTYLKKCTFLINLKGLSPFKWIDKISE
ncbi:MAG: M1 family metallopeptidase [Saprospiraceae bacterium]